MLLWLIQVLQSLKQLKSIAVSCQSGCKVQVRAGKAGEVAGPDVYEDDDVQLSDSSYYNDADVMFEE
jgi:hypothetical protein